jgi:DNA (cytosine-5)-methyltransferase 1
MSQDITVTDLFCGAGGSSIGAERAGARLRMAANHWRLAIDTHNTNFPDADHDCADISQVSPKRYPRTDILIASPECTNHSQAKGKKPEATIWEPEPEGLEAVERSRATMWDVPRFAEIHHYSMIVVENVVEASRWIMWDAWLMAMHALGYEHRVVSLNSFVAQPTPQSRDRIYVVFWRRGNTEPNLDFRADAYCPSCDERVEAVQSWKNGKRIGRYRQQYLYSCPRCAGQVIPFAYPAASAIDWSLPTQRIGDRAKPLADATMRRIRAGLEKYGPAAIVQAAGNTFERRPGVRSWPTTLPLPTQTTTAQHALVVDTAYAHRSQEYGGSIDEVMPTFTTAYTRGLLTVPDGVLVNVLRPNAEDEGKVRSSDEPFATQTSRAETGLVVPLRRNGEAKTTDEVMPTFAAGGQHHALLMRPYTPRGDEAQMFTPVSEVARTLTAGGSQFLVEPFLTDYHGNGGARPVSSPFGAVDTGDRNNLVIPELDVDDCGFRMLEPHEIGAAMAFPSDYTVLGTKRDRVRQYGNAVTPPVMDKILQRCIDSLKPSSEVAA